MQRMCDSNKYITQLMFFKRHSHPNGLYWGHQCSWILTPANSMQVSNMQSDCNRKQACLTQAYLGRDVWGRSTRELCAAIYLVSPKLCNMQIKNAWAQVSLNVMFRTEIMT